MNHPRQEIRAELVRLLSAKDNDGEFVTGAKARVYDSRDIPLDAEKLPAILLYTVDDEIDPDTRHDGGTRRRTMTVRVEAYQTGDEAAADVDELALQVEAVLNASPSLSNKVETARLVRSTIDFAENGESALFAAVMDLEIVYWTNLVEETGTRPRLFLGFDPETGPGNESRYFEVGAIDPEDYV